MDDRVVIHVVPYIVSSDGFSRALNKEEMEAVGMKKFSFDRKTSSYMDSLLLLKEKLTLIQECLRGD